MLGVFNARYCDAHADHQDVYSDAGSHRDLLFRCCGILSVSISFPPSSTERRCGRSFAYMLLRDCLSSGGRAAACSAIVLDSSEAMLFRLPAMRGKSSARLRRYIDGDELRSVGNLSRRHAVHRADLNYHRNRCLKTRLYKWTHSRTRQYVSCGPC